MLISLPIPVIIILDFFGWLMIHLSVAYIMTRLPEHLFPPESWLFKTRRWESGGRVYQHVFRVKHWKRLLPDGAALFRSGFRKKQLGASDREYYQLFVRETCRGELTHWIVMLSAPVFFVWNWWWACIIMVVYAVAANAPCIITQRYNRIRIKKVLNHPVHVPQENSGTGYTV